MTDVPGLRAGTGGHLLAAGGGWWDALAAHPARTLVAVVGLVAVTAGAGLVLRRSTRRMRSLRGQVLAVSFAAILVGAAAAVVLARLMVIDDAELPRVVAVLGLTGVVAAVLVLVGTTPLGHDVRRLEDTVRSLEHGDREVRTGVVRADELGHVARALDELTARLDHLERQRADVEAERAAMLSSVGHDLRTPLAALRVAVEALADGVAPDPPRYLRSMQRDVDALAALVDDFFLLARIGSGGIEALSEPVDLSEVADEAVEALTPVAAAARVDLVLDATRAVPVVGNATALGRVVRNLIDNAVRHAPRGSVVRVAVSGDGGPLVRVTDDGPGFSAAFAGEAFDAFTRDDASRTRSTGGAGLGLAIARGLVEAHGGRIWIEGPPGGRVAFELPEPAGV